MSPHLISRVTILGTGLIGGSFALALRKYTTEMHISGWDRPDIIREAQKCGAVDEAFSGDLAPALHNSDLIYIALPIAATIDLLPEIARRSSSRPRHRRLQHQSPHRPKPPTNFSPAKMARSSLAAIHGRQGTPRNRARRRRTFPRKHLRPDRQIFRTVAAGLQSHSFPIPKETDPARDPRISAFVKILEKIGARPLWLGAQQHDYAVGLASHLPQLAAVALAGFLYDRLDENGLPITLAGPGLRDSLRLAGSPYSTWRDIVLTNQEVLSAALDLFAAASTIFARNSPPANSKPTSTPPTNSTNSSARSKHFFHTACSSSNAG